jgi:hypothetical protein
MTKPRLTARQIAEKHWGYNEQLIRLLLYKEAPDVIMLILVISHYLYTEAFIHGYKHAKEGK